MLWHDLRRRVSAGRPNTTTSTVLLARTCSATFMVPNISPLPELPAEILDQIFQYITPFRLDSRLVCKAFDVAGKRRGRASFKSLFIFVDSDIITLPR